MQFWPAIINACLVLLLAVSKQNSVVQQLPYCLRCSRVQVLSNVTPEMAIRRQPLARVDVGSRYGWRAALLRARCTTRCQSARRCLLERCDLYAAARCVC
jgi:hypothetical protein